MPWVHFGTGSAVTSDTGHCSGSGTNCFSDADCPIGEVCRNLIASIVISANPLSGFQHARLRVDTNVGSNTNVGVRSPIFAPPAVASSTISMQVYISQAGGAGYYWRPFDAGGSGTAAANVCFAPNDVQPGEQLMGAVAIDVAPDADDDGPDICVLSDLGTGLVFVATGAEWSPGAYKELQVSVDPVTTTVTYLYDGVPIFLDNSLVSADKVDSFHLRHDNRQRRTCDADGFTDCNDGSDCVSGNCASVEFADVDDITINVDLIPGACCNGSSCSEETSDHCLFPANFLGPATDCSSSPCLTGRCCDPSSGTCSIVSAFACAGLNTYTGGLTSCVPNCCNAPPKGGDACDTLAAAIETIPVPGSSVRSGYTGTASGPDCTLFDPDPLWWEAFTITGCANVLISYCCSGEATSTIRSPVYSTLIKDACPCETATVIRGADLTSVGFGGTDPDVCAEGNFHARWINLQPGTWYLPIYVDDMGNGGPVSTADYQLQIVTSTCPTGGCCTGSMCSTTNVVNCTNGGGNYLGNNVSCTFSCANGACCLPGQTCENRTSVACGANANNGNTYFGGIVCASLTCVGGAIPGAPCDMNSDCTGGGTCTGPLAVPTCPPANDKCSRAATLNDGATPFTNIGALDDGAEDFCQISATTADIWYRYTASCTGTVNISLCGSTPDYDSTLSVYTDVLCPIDTTTRFACNDDFDCDGNGTADDESWSEVEFSATIGTTYTVRIGSAQGGGESGSGVINVRCTGCPCNGDVDGDGAIHPADLLIVLGCVNCGSSQNPSCDVNCDGMINLHDLGDEVCLLYNPPSECCPRPHGACLDTICMLVPGSFCATVGGNYLGDGVPCPAWSGDCNGNGIGDGCEQQCTVDTNCCDGMACTCDKCVCNVCVHYPVPYGDANCDCRNDLDDLLCVLRGFASYADCPRSDIHPPCTGQGIINLDDILAALRAFAGENPCFQVCNVPCPQAACCHGSTCDIETSSECIESGGMYQGNGSLCPPLAPNPCPPPHGACLHGSMCDMESPLPCILSGGEYQGNDTSCPP